LVKEDERGGQGHTFASILHQSCETVLWTHIVFTWVLFNFVFCFFLWLMAKLSNMFCVWSAWNVSWIWCSGWPSTSRMTENVEKIQELIHEDHHRIIHELADTTGIS
jgi:hypothetical protein